MNAYVQWLHRTRRFGLWVGVAIVWIGFALAAHFLLPNLTSEISSFNLAAFLPSTAGPNVAARQLRTIATRSPNQAYLIVLHSPQPLTPAERQWFARQSQHLSGWQVEGPASATGPSPFLGSHGETDFVAVTPLPQRPASVSTTLAFLSRHFASPFPGAHAYVTGSSAIETAYAHSALTGVQRTLVVTLTLVLLIGIVVFRSPIAALLPLFVVGTSFLVTDGIVAWLGHHGLPVSSYTQTFLIVVLFGAGTDYSILVLMRLREEWRRTSTPLDVVRSALPGVLRDLVAIPPERRAEAYLARFTALWRQAAQPPAERALRVTRPTLIMGMITLTIPFGTLVSARFALYRSGVGVAIGLIVLGVALTWVLPALVVGLGPFLFWPRRLSSPSGTAGSSGQAGLASRLTRLEQRAIRRPILVLAVLGLVGGLSVGGTGPLSFNQVRELPPMSPAVQAYRWMVQAFGAGHVMPVYVVLHDARANFRSPSGLAALGDTQSLIATVPGVRRVSGPTAPLGVPLSAFQVRTQSQATQSVLIRIGHALATASHALAQAERGSPSLSTSIEGLVRASAGLQAINATMLAPLAAQQGFRTVVPPSALQAAAVQRILAAYISPDGHTATLVVTLAGNPYGASAMARLAAVRRAAVLGLATTPYHAAAVHLGGTTATNLALRTVTRTDFVRTVIVILAVIGVMLMVFLRSVPVAGMVLGLIGLNYLATMRITRWIAIRFLHDQGVAWPVPFFSFLLLVGLGVDYVLFYMARFRETEPIAGREAIVAAAEAAAEPILSAVAVMMGTFSSLFATGVVTLEEVAVAVVVGLLLDLGLLLGIAMPLGLWALYPIRHWPFPLRHLWYRPGPPPAAGQ